MTDTALDAPETDNGLARAFQLPAEIQADETLAALYQEMVASLRREAQGLAMNTLQQILIERIASLYVQIKYREANGGFNHPNQQKDFNQYWLSLTQEFNRLLLANQDKLRDSLLRDITKVVLGVVDDIVDDDIRRTVRLQLSEGLAAIGQ